MAGYFLLLAGISSTLSFSSNFFRLVAWRDLEALAEKRAIKSMSSLRLSSVFLF
jgi:hypothetical protein